MTVAVNRSRTFFYIALCIGNLSAFGMGIALGWSSPIIAMANDPSRLSENPFGRIITAEEGSWIGALLPLGALFGPLIAGITLDKLGRKKSLIFLCGVPLLMSYIILAFAKTISLYYIGRFIQGIGSGSVFTILPIFSSEISEVAVRGLASSSLNIFMVSGQFFAYVVGPYTSVMLYNLTCAVWPAAFIVLFALFVPESPYYLIANGDYDNALESLKKFRSSNEQWVVNEMESIKISVENSMKNRGTFIDIFKTRGLIKAFIISVSLVAFQQLSGIGAVLGYSQDIFKAAGDMILPEVASIIVGFIRLAASFITPLICDRAGRKPLHVISAIGIIISYIPLGLYYYLKEHDYYVDGIFWLPIASMMAYIITYNLGFGPLPWTVMAESFPAHLKAAASTSVTIACWTCTFLMFKFFSNISELIGIGGAFWLFAGFSVVALVFVTTYMIETKGKTFDEIQELLSK